MQISKEQINRYIGQINLKKISIIGQKKLLNSRVLIIGVGGLGTPALNYLARAGVEHFGIVDPDKVSLSNIHRQILFEKKDIGKLKTTIAKKKILEINKQIKIQTFPIKINKVNIKKIINNYDIILDCTDSFKSKLEINDSCLKEKKILITGAVSRFIGHLFVFNFQSKKIKSPCLRCFMPVEPVEDRQDCQAEGILGTVTGLIGILMANETMKEIISGKNTLCGKILHVDLDKTDFRLITLSKNKNCKH